MAILLMFLRDIGLTDKIDHDMIAFYIEQMLSIYNGTI